MSWLGTVRDELAGKVFVTDLPKERSERGWIAVLRGGRIKSGELLLKVVAMSCDQRSDCLPS